MYPHSMPIPRTAAALIMLLSAPAYAQIQDRPPVLDALQAQGLAVVQEFDAGADLRGFAGAAGNRPIAVYVTRDGRAIVGTRVDADGKPVDELTLHNLVAKPMGDKTWAELESATWVRDGNADAPRVIYTFSDANCPYCHKFWEAARPWVDAGKVQLRHLLVGVIRDDSPAKAAAILGAADPSAALQDNERRFEQGGIEPAQHVPDSVSRTLAANQMLMLASGFRGTPGIVVREYDGTVQKFSGMPQGPQLEEVLGPR